VGLVRPYRFLYLGYWVIPGAIVGVGCTLASLVAGLLLPFRKRVWFPVPYLFVANSLFNRHNTQCTALPSDSYQWQQWGHLN